MREDVLEKQVNSVDPFSIADEVLEPGVINQPALLEVLEQESTALMPRTKRARLRDESLFEPGSSEDLQARISVLKADLEEKKRKLGEVVANFSEQELTAPQEKKIRNAHAAARIRVKKRLNFLQNRLIEEGLKQENEKLRAELELLIFARGESTSSDQGSSKGFSAEEQKQREIARSIAEERKCEAKANLMLVRELNKKSKDFSEQTKEKNSNRAASTLFRINRKCQYLEQEDRLLSARNENTVLKEKIALLSPVAEKQVSGVDSSSIADEVLELGVINQPALLEVLEQESTALTPRTKRGRPRNESLFEPGSSEDLQARISILKADLEEKEKKLGELVADSSEQELTAPQEKKIRNVRSSACSRMRKRLNFLQNKLAEQGLKQENETLRIELVNQAKNPDQFVELLTFVMGESTSSDQGSSKGLSAEEQKQREIARSIAEERKREAKANLMLVRDINKKSKDFSKQAKGKNRNRAASTFSRINWKCEYLEQEDRLLSASNENTRLKEKIALLGPVLEKQVNGVDFSSIADEVLELGVINQPVLLEVLEQESTALTPRTKKGRPKDASLFEPESSEDLQARIFTLKVDLEEKEKKLGEVVASFSRQKLTILQRKRIKNAHASACSRVEKTLNFTQNKLAEEGLRQENEKLRAELVNQAENLDQFVELLTFPRGESTSSDQGSLKGLSAEEQKQREIVLSIAEERKRKAEENLMLVRELNKKSEDLSKQVKIKNRNRAASTLSRINRKFENIEQKDRLLSAKNENTLLKERIALLSPREEYSVVLPVISPGLFGGELNSHVDEQPPEDLYSSSSAFNFFHP